MLVHKRVQACVHCSHTCLVSVVMNALQMSMFMLSLQKIMSITGH